MWQARGEEKYKWGFGFKKPERKRPLRTLRHKWEDTKIHLKWDGRAWIGCMRLRTQTSGGLL
jgi:hypothetical protein